MPECILMNTKKFESFMNHIEIGQHVKLAQFESYIFTVTAVHADGSVDIETTLDGQQILNYEKVAREMLKRVEEEK